MNEKNSVYELTSPAAVASKKKASRMPFDMIICLLMIFLLVSALTTLFMLNRKGEVLSSPIGENMGDATRETQGTTYSYVSKVNVDTSETSTDLLYASSDAAISSTYTMPAEIMNIENVRKVGDAYVVEHTDGSTSTFTEGFGYAEVNIDAFMDDILPPSSSDMAIEQALNKKDSPLNVALAANATATNDQTLRTNGSATTIFSGGSITGPYSNGGSGSGISNCYYVVGINGSSVWYKYLARNGGYVQGYGNFNAGWNQGSWGSNYRVDQQGCRWSSSNGDWTDRKASWISTSTGNYYFSYHSRSICGSQSHGKSDKEHDAQITGWMRDISLQIQHTNSTTPTVALNTSYSTWAEYRQVAIKGTENTFGVKKLQARYANSASSGVDAKLDTWDNLNSGNADKAVVAKSTSQPAYSRVWAQAYGWNNRYSSEASFDAVTLKLDGAAPEINSYAIVASNTATTGVGMTNAATLYFYVKARDVGGNYRVPSGIKTVTVTNSTSGFSSSSTNRVTGVAFNTVNNTGWTEIWIAVTGSQANGSWTVTVNDQVSGHSTSKSYSFANWDNSAPTVSDLSITAAGTAVKDSATNENWTRQGLNVSFKVTDTWGATYANVPYNSAINSATFSYTINGKAYSLSLTKGTVTTSGRTVYCTYSTNKVLMYDFYTLSGATVTVKDNVGNTNAYSFSLASTAGGVGSTGTSRAMKTASNASVTPSITGRLDTVAPEVTATTVKKNAWTDNWGGSFAVDVTVKDYSYADSNGSYFYSAANNYYNNGSGVYKLYFYADSGRTKPLTVASTTVGTASSNVVTITTGFKTLSSSPVVSFNYDTKNTAFGGNVYVFAEDRIGNLSYGNAPTGVSYANADVSPLSSNYTNNKVWLYPGTNGVTSAGKSYFAGVKRDTFKPQVVVKNSADQIVASSNAVSSTSTKYTFPWRDGTSEAYKIVVYYGGSGGRLLINGSATDTIAEGNGTFSNYNFTGSGTLGTAPAVSKSTTGAASFSAGATSTTYGKSYATQGQNSITVQFTNGAGQSSDAITLTFRLDNSAPTVELMGFLADGSQSVSTQAQVNTLLSESDLLNLNRWRYPDKDVGYKAVFKVSDGTGSGIVRDNVADKEKAYGVNGTSASQKTYGYARYYYDIGDNITQAASSVGTKVGGTGSDVGAGNSARVEFKYADTDGHVYTYTDSYYVKSVSGITYGGSAVNYIVEIPMFSRTKLNTIKATDGTTKIIEKMGEDWIGHVSANTFFRFKVGVSDFLGHVGYAYQSSTNRPNGTATGYEWEPEKTAGTGNATSVMRWYVDPFPVKINTYAMYEMKNADAVPDIATTSITSFTNPYKIGEGAGSAVGNYGSEFRNNGWAKNTVIVELNVYSGLSGYSAMYYYKDLASTFSSTAPYKTEWYNSYGAGNINVPGEEAVYSKNKAWLVFQNSTTRNIGIKISVSGKAYDGAGLVTGDYKYKLTGGRNDPLMVKQDVSKPIIESVFLSADSDYDLAKNNRMLTFNASADTNGNYTFTLDKANSPYYKMTLPNYTYAAVKPYVYIRVTDKTGDLMGSGIKSVSFNGAVYSTKVNTVDVTSEVWRSSTTYAYNRTGVGTDTPGYNITVTDYQDNVASTTYGYNDKNGYRTLPVLDSYDVYIRLERTNQGGYLNTSGNDLFPTGPNATTTSSQPRLTMSGNPIKNSNFTATLKFAVGISGINIYIRRKDYTDTNKLDSFTYFSAGGYLPKNYSLGADGWSFYQGSTWMTPAGTTKYIKSYRDNPNATGSFEEEMTLEFSLTTVKERYEVLAVNGTGKYYIIDLGALYIDTEAPTIHDATTFFTVASDKDTATCDYGDLQRVWTNEVQQKYTNGDVFIYYYVTDSASGIADGGVRLSGSTTTLDLVTVRNVPVWTINGTKTTIRRITEDAPTITNVNGNFALNGYVARTLDDKAEALAFTSTEGAIIGKEVADLKFYRLRASAASPYTILAEDSIGNAVNTASVKTHTPAIDKSPVNISIAARTNENDTSYTGYTGEKFTNQSVRMRWYAVYGQSGFGGFNYKVKRHLSGATVTEKISIPFFKKQSDGNIYMYYYQNGNNTDLKEKTLAITSFGFKVKAQNSGGTYYWYVKGTNTNVVVNQAIYGTASLLTTFDWTINDGSLYCYLDRTNTANVKDEYSVTVKNNVVDDYAVGRTRPTGTNVKDNKGFFVKIDIVKPTIDINSGNIAELASTTQWHALAKSIRVAISDDLSGIAPSGNSFSATVPVEKVKVQFQNGDTALDVGEATLVKDADGLYRAYSLVKNGSFMKKDGLLYVDRYTPYTITAEDEAGNVATYTFTPQIDSVEAAITSVKLYKNNDTPYDENTVTVKWVNEVSGNRRNWTDDKVYAVFTVNYGRSGYDLQYRRSFQSGNLTSGAWTTINSAEYSVIGTTNNGDGTFTDTVKYYIGVTETNMYYYYRFRAISKAVDTELNVYKSFTNPSAKRASEKNDNSGITITLESYEANDKGQTTATIALSAAKDSGLIAIDKIVPTVGTNLAYKQNATTYTTYGAQTDGNWTIGETEWKNTDVRMSLALESASNFASGNVVYYRTSENGTNWTNWTMIYPGNKSLYQLDSTGKWSVSGAATSTNYTYTPTARPHADNNGTTISYYLNEFAYTLTTSQNNVAVEMYVENGAGNVSPTYRFGTGSGETLRGIKIDMNKAEVVPTASETFTEYTTAYDTIQNDLKREYVSSVEYLTRSSDVGYTFKNTVIIRMQITNVGYSGVNVMIDGMGGVDGRIMDYIGYDEFMSERDTVGAVYRYYYVNTNGEQIHKVYARSVAGTESEKETAYIKIDNTRPVLYVTDISGTKATNWGWDSSKNLYATTPEYWYVSSLGIALEVGKVEKNGTYAKNPYSGYTLEYAVKKNGAWGAWVENRGELITLDGTLTYDAVTGKTVDNIVRGDEYKFRITSGAGLSYVVGEDVFDNQNVKLFGVADLNTKAAALDGKDIVKAHVVKNGEGDYDDASYTYKFYVDATYYYYEYSARVDLGNGTEDRNTDAFTSYAVKKANASNVFGATAETRFHRGDVLEFTYEANYDKKDVYGYNYYQNYTMTTAGNRVLYHTVGNNDFGVFDGVVRKPDRGSNPDGEPHAQYERTGSFRVQFEENNIVVLGDYLAEVDVTYGNDYFYMQTQSKPWKTTGTASYSLKSDIGLNYTYYAYDSTFLRGDAEQTDDPNKVGGYFVYTQIAPGAGSFRVTEETQYKDYVIKYFGLTNSQQTSYRVNNVTDFSYVDDDYFDLKENREIDTTVRSYLAHAYILTDSLTIENTLEGTFTGTFDGNGKTITLVTGGKIESDYGLFGSIGGTVKNLSVKADGKVTIDADGTVQVGLVARAIVSGGKVENVSVVADVELKKFVGGSNFGGIAATSAGAIGGTDPTFTDVRITNNGKAMQDGNVSAVVGYAKSGTSFNNVYVFGEIELYNVTGMNAGMLYGKIDAGTYNASEVNYFNKNVFVNASTVLGASNCTSEATFTSTVSGVTYDLFANLDDDWMAGAVTEWTNVGGEDVMTKNGGVSVRREILARLYNDFGYSEEDFENTTYGDGSTTRPLVISTVSHIQAVNGYMNLSFALKASEEGVDMTTYKPTVAVTKVFNGTLTTTTGGYVKLTNFAGNAQAIEKPLFGLFGQLNGTVKNLVFDEIGLNLNYQGDEDLYVGIVAAKAYAEANVTNVMFIGEQKVVAPNAKAYVGGVIGSGENTTVNDVFNVNNLSASAKQVFMGGIAGVTNGITLPEATGTIFLLGRVEASGAMLNVGSAIGKVEETSTVTGGQRVYAILNNVYIGGQVIESKTVGTSANAYNMKTVDFNDDAMRTASFASVGGSAFETAFGNYYPLRGLGSAASPFIIENEKDFNNINLILYANYRIDSDVTFTSFRTIGEGLMFSGVIKGYVGDDISAENGKVVSLVGVTAPLVYYNAGSISELSVNVEYTASVKAGETFRYGAIAVYSEGEIKNVTVSGNVNITSEAQDTTLYVSGFVGVSYGGVVEVGKLQNSISALTINVNGGGVAYIGGYAGVVERGQASFSYGIATGTINVTNVRHTYAGLLVGQAYGSCDWVLGDAASIDYTYTITVDGVEIPKYDEDDNPLTENFYGIEFVEE